MAKPMNPEQARLAVLRMREEARLPPQVAGLADAYRSDYEEGQAEAREQALAEVEALMRAGWRLAVKGKVGEVRLVPPDKSQRAWATPYRGKTLAEALATVPKPSR